MKNVLNTIYARLKASEIFNYGIKFNVTDLV